MSLSLPITGWAMVLVAHGFLLDCIDPPRQGFDSMSTALHLKGP